ncbi:uncharacterized protein [Henckelia pumila]|uniref:uncharacterized protein n=1 Tax=Henckelia pumila TaxID=405737 RepID=UPI003C6E99AF
MESLRSKMKKMMKYAKALDKTKEGFIELNMELIPRAENIKADHLTRLDSALSDQIDPIVSARKALLAGFFWPTMRKDSSNLVNSCYNCQRHANLQCRPAEYMRAMVAACPFDQSGLVSDNERQFCGAKVQAWCQEMKIEQVFTSVSYLKGNGQVEITNRTIVQALKIRLDTTKAVILFEIEQENARIMAYGVNNQELRAMDLGLLEESRARATIRLASYRKRMTQAYNKRVHPKVFEEGDLVMRKIQHQGERGKLDAKYEGSR